MKKRVIQETFAYHEYVNSVKTKSQIDQDKTNIIDVSMRCPKCKQTLPLLSHGASQKCTCGLEMTLLGNGLCCTSRLYN